MRRFSRRRPIAAETDRKEVPLPLEERRFVFPWLLLLVTVVATFLLENKMDAPLHWGDTASIANLIQGANEGDPVRKTVIVILGGIGLFLLRRYRKNIHFNGIVTGCVFAYFSWIGLSVAWASDPALTGRRLIALALMLIFTAGLVVRMDADLLLGFVAGIPTLMLIPGVMAEIHAGTFHPLTAGYRFCGTAAHPNVQAANLSFAVILFCWLTWRARGRSRFLYLCLTGATGTFLLLTGSRTSILAVLAALLLSLAMAIARDHRRKLYLFAASLLLLVGAGIFSSFFVVSTSGDSAGVFELLPTHGTQSDLSTLNGRSALWQECLGFAMERPLTGYGYGGFWSADRIEKISADQGWVIEQSHSAYIDQLLALGIPGALMYAALLGGFLLLYIKRFYRGDNSSGAWAALLFFVVIHGFTESIDIMPMFTNFAIHLVVLQAALVRNGRALERTAVHAPQTPALAY